MSRASRRAGLEHSLELMEAEFTRTFGDALQRCAAGTCDLFGQNDAAIAQMGRYLRDKLASADAAALLELGDAIEEARAQLGLPPFEHYQRYLKYRRRRGDNRPGEPALARELLAEINGVL